VSELDIMARAAAATRDAVDLVTVQYDTGLTDSQNVLDIQRSLFEQQDQLLVSESRAVLGLIGLYRVLSGGWDFEGADAPPGAAQEGGDPESTPDGS